MDTVQFTLNTTPKYLKTSSNTPSAHKYTLPHSQLECLSSDFKNVITCYDLATGCLHKYLAKINTKKIILISQHTRWVVCIKESTYSIYPRLAEYSF